MTDYATIEDLREYLRIPDEADDVILGLAISTASREIARSINRDFEPQLTEAEERSFESSGKRVVIDDLFTDDDLVVEGVTDYRLYPLRANPWTELVSDYSLPMIVKVTAKFGWPEVPSAIQQATLLQASRIVARRDSPYGVAGSPDAGTELRLLARVDPDVEVAIGPYRRWWAAW